ncbi:MULTISPECIES: gpW family head-tail joining protein [Paracoccus]|uniref:gpW family head-tail joining protein n=1 Tax=Paracoccus TaxID=265 RepID=UPI000DF7AD9C|nr:MULTISPECIES: gpW family head-tail joining protein [Paracoccus]RDD72896.1 hypothetical protein DVR11_02915 [Paracoccus versutus]
MDKQIIRKRLNVAYEQYDKLMTGRAQRVIVDQNGERIEYAVANADRLERYIATLEAQLADCPSTRRVIGPLFFEG